MAAKHCLAVETGLELANSGALHSAPIYCKGFGGFNTQPCHHSCFIVALGQEL